MTDVADAIAGFLRHAAGEAALGLTLDEARKAIARLRTMPEFRVASRTCALCRSLRVTIGVAK